MRSIFVLGSINVDLFFSIPHMPKQGESISSSSFISSFGGKGANQAIAIAKAGITPIFIGRVGDDAFGHDCLANLSSYGLSTSFIHTSSKPTGMASIYLSNHDNRIVVAGLANQDIQKEDIDMALAKAKPGDYFLTQLETNLDMVLYALKKAKAIGLTTFLNPSPSIKLPKDIYPYIDTMIVNHLEACFYASLPLSSSFNDIYDNLSILGIKHVYITLGDKGSIYLDKDKQIREPARKITPVDTTGAGDTYTGYLLASLAKDMDIKASMKMASMASSLTCLKLGCESSIPSLSEVASVLSLN